MIPALEELGQEECKFENNLGYILGPLSKDMQQKEQRMQNNAPLFEFLFVVVDDDDDVNAFK